MRLWFHPVTTCKKQDGDIFLLLYIKNETVAILLLHIKKQDGDIVILQLCKKSRWRCHSVTITICTEKQDGDTILVQYVKKKAHGGIVLLQYVKKKQDVDTGTNSCSMWKTRQKYYPAPDI